MLVKLIGEPIIDQKKEPSNQDYVKVHYFYKILCRNIGIKWIFGKI